MSACWSDGYLVGWTVCRLVILSYFPKRAGGYTSICPLSEHLVFDEWYKRRNNETNIIHIKVQFETVRNQNSNLSKRQQFYWTIAVRDDDIKENIGIYGCIKRVNFPSHLPLLQSIRVASIHNHLERKSRIFHSYFSCRSPYLFWNIPPTPLVIIRVWTVFGTID